MRNVLLFSSLLCFGAFGHADIDPRLMEHNPHVIEYFQNKEETLHEFAEAVQTRLAEPDYDDTVYGTITETYEKVLRPRLEESIQTKFTKLFTKTELSHLAEYTASPVLQELSTADLAPILEQLIDEEMLEAYVEAALIKFANPHASYSLPKLKLDEPSEDAYAFAAQTPEKVLIDHAIRTLPEQLADSLYDLLVMGGLPMAEAKKFCRCFTQVLKEFISEQGPHLSCVLVAQYYDQQLGDKPELMKEAAYFYSREFGKGIGAKYGRLLNEMLTSPTEKRLLNTWLNAINAELKQKGCKTNIYRMVKIDRKGNLVVSAEKGSSFDLDEKEIFRF